MRLRVTDDAPTNLSYPYTDRLEPGDEFEVADEKGAALQSAHGYLVAIDSTEETEDGDALTDLTKAELYERATNAEIGGRSQMSKGELIDALRED